MGNKKGRQVWTESLLRLRAQNPDLGALFKVQYVCDSRRFSFLYDSAAVHAYAAKWHFRDIEDAKQEIRAEEKRLGKDLPRKREHVNRRRERIFSDVYEYGGGHQ